VGRDDDVVDVEQGAIGRDGFLREHVNRRAREHAVLDGLGEGILVDDPAACTVDHVPSLQFRQFGLPDHVLRLRGQRGVNRDELRAGQTLRDRLDQFRTEFLRALR
jgi:hypothetical protein